MTLTGMYYPSILPVRPSEDDPAVRVLFARLHMIRELGLIKTFYSRAIDHSALSIVASHSHRAVDR